MSEAAVVGVVEVGRRNTAEPTPEAMVAPMFS